MGALVGVQILNYILPLIAIPVIVRIIGPEKFGIINYVSSITSYLILLIGFSFELSASRVIAMNQGDHEKLNSIFNKVFFAKAFLFAASVFIYTAIFFSSDTLQQDRPVAIFSFLICIAYIFDCNYLYVAKQDLKQTAMFNLITKVALNLCLLIFIREKGDYIYQPLIISLAQIIVGVGAFFWAIRRYTLSITFPGLKAVWSIIWRDKILFFHSFAHTVYTTLNIIMLGYFKGITEVGFYSAGWKLIILIQALLISPLGMVLFPIIGQAFGKSKEEGIAIVQKMLPVVFFSTLIIAVGILTVGGVFIHIFYGAKFLESVIIFKILALMPMMLALNMLFGIQTMVNLKMDKYFFGITLSAAFLNILLNLVLIHFWGSEGAAISWFITETYCAVAMYALIKRRKIELLNLKYFSFSIVKATLEPIISKFKERIKKSDA
ncbi:MAG: oligosaccharide flippase family protein [Bacteroidota bacterium]